MRRSLTDQDILDIRELYSTGQFTQQQLADKYDCSDNTISIWLDPNEERRKKKFTYSIYRKRESLCDCGKPLKGHVKCSVCGILVHGDCDCQIKKTYFSSLSDY